MAVKYDSDSEEFKEFTENHLKKYQLNILGASTLSFFINSIVFMYTAFKFFLKPILNDLENSEKKKMKGGNVFR